MSSKSSFSKFIVWGILALLILAMGGFGTSQFGSSIQNAATVGKTKVSVDEYSRALQSQLQNLQRQFGTQISAAQAEQFGIPSLVLSQLTSQAALDGEAKRLSLSIGDENLRQAILGLGSFNGLDGTFDAELYRDSLRRIGLNEKDFEDSIRKENTRAILVGAIATGISLPQSYGDTVVTWLTEERDIITARLTSDAVLDSISEPTEEELRAFYNNNEARFTSPEMKALTYIWLTPNSLSTSIDVDENEVRALYEENKAIYNQAERRLIERLVFGTDEEAQNAVDRISSGASTFEAEVAARDLTLIDVDMGDLTQAELGTNGENIFAANTNETVGPFDTDIGPAIFRINGVIDATNTSFEDAKPEIEAALKVDLAARELSNVYNDVDDLLASGATLEEIAQETPMQLVELNWHEGITGEIESLSTFTNAAQAALVGDFPEVIELQNGGIFSLRSNAIIAPELKPYDEVKSDVTRLWEQEEITSALTNKAAELESKVASGTFIADLGLVTKEYNGLTRQENMDDLPEGFIDAIFAPELKEGATTLINDENSILIAKISRVSQPSENSENTSIAENYNFQASQSVSQDVIAAFTEALQEREGVTINQAALNAVHSHLR